MGNIADQLKQVEYLAKGGRLTRFLSNPTKYFKAMYLLKVVYPKTHKGSLIRTPVFFDEFMTVLLPAATDIYLTGGKTHDSELRLAKFMIANLKKGDRFLDIGAHFGYFSLLSSACVGGKGRVLGVEAARGTFEILRENIVGKGNIEVVHNAVSDKNEEVSFFEFPVLYSEYNALNIEQFEKEDWIKENAPQKVQVQAKTIDALLEEESFKPDMIKIDVEGAEVQAISGGARTWDRISPVVIMEYLTGSGASYGEATEIMREYGYVSHMIDDNGELVVVADIDEYMNKNNTTSENVVFAKSNK